MVKKLHFKGDPIKKKKVKSDKSGFKKEENSELDERADSNGLFFAYFDLLHKYLRLYIMLAWVRPNDASHIRGPTVLLHTQGPSVLVFNSTVKKPLIHSLPESDTIEAFTPDDISNVWVASTLSGTDTLTLRSADGKFLASDSLGSVTALREARGPNEQWRPIVQQDGSVALMSIYDKFLAQDETAGEFKFNFCRLKISLIIVIKIRRWPNNFTCGF